MKPRLAIALDVADRAQMMEWASKFLDLDVVLKIGLGLVPLLDANDYRFLRDQGFDLFVDVKLHDIPSQVARAVTAWAGWGARYVTVHLSGGSEMLRQAQAAAEDTGLTLLGVSVLTSLHEKDLKAVGVDASVSEQVLRLARLGFEAGLRGFVCSVHEAQALREALGNDLTLTTPGLVLEPGQGHSDQARIATVPQAVAAGSKLLVMGRSILHHPEPRPAVEALLRQLDHG